MKLTAMARESAPLHWGSTQPELAAKLGIHLDPLCTWETEKRIPLPKHMVKVNQFLEKRDCNEDSWAWDTLGRPLGYPA